MPCKAQLKRLRMLLLCCSGDCGAAVLGVVTANGEHEMKHRGRQGSRCRSVTAWLCSMVECGMASSAPPELVMSVAGRRAAHIMPLDPGLRSQKVTSILDSVKEPRSAIVSQRYLAE